MTDSTTKIRAILEEMKKVEGAATKGPWGARFPTMGGNYPVTDSEDKELLRVWGEDDPDAEHTARFIAQSRSWILPLIEALEEMLDAAEFVINRESKPNDHGLALDPKTVLRDARDRAMDKLEGKT